MSVKFKSIFVAAFIAGGLMGFSIYHEAPAQSSAFSVPATAKLPLPGSPELHDLATQPRYPLVTQPASH
jgi:hypothetical protein